MSQIEISLPFFDGFYESVLSGMIDSALEQTVDYDLESLSDESYEKFQEANELLMDSVDFNKARLQLSQDFVDVWLSDFEGETSSKIDGLSFSELDSPREYNFSTDEIFVNVDRSNIKKWYVHSRAEKHETLAQVVKDEFTPCNGWIPFYSDNINTWVAKPLNEWDSIEVGILLKAYCLSFDINFESIIRESVCDMYEIVDDAIDSAYDIDNLAKYESFVESCLAGR